MTLVAKTECVCPMHLQIVQDAPGSCPICGMALEHRAVHLGEEESPELVLMRRRFWGSALFTVPLFVLGMAPMVPGDPVGSLLPRGWRNPLELVLSTPVVLWGGWPFFQRAWASVKFKSPNMFTLVAFGSGAAFVYSLVATFAPGSFPPTFREHYDQVGVYSRRHRSSSRPDGLRAPRHPGQATSASSRVWCLGSLRMSRRSTSPSLARSHPSDENRSRYTVATSAMESTLRGVGSCGHEWQ